MSERAFWLCLVALTVTVGCGSIKRMSANMSGWSKACVEGVSYIQFPSGVSVQYDTAGKVVGCQ